MINSVLIKNFQSHKNTQIDFDSGVTVVIGGSDQGKSAILRAILWAVNNRPLGTDDIVSHWARDKKGKIEEEMLVQITTENGFVIRRRTENANQYALARIGEKDVFFNAINKDVPEDIQKFFRLSDVNIQQQHDSPFLLSQSPGDVAKYFNKIVRLDVIDKVLSNAESARRDANKKIKECEQEKTSLEKQLEGYDWIEQAQELTERLSKINERIYQYDDAWQVIDCEVRDYAIQKEYLKDFPDIKTANAIIEKIEGIKIDYDALNELEKSIEKYKEVNRDRKIFETVKPGKNILCEIDFFIGEIVVDDARKKILQKEIDEYTENKKLSDMGFDKKQALDIIREIEAIRPEYDTLRLLGLQIQEYDNAMKNREQAVVEKTEYVKQLPDVCPECGQPLRECKDD